MRALEVLDASGRSILEWQAERGQPLIDRDSARFLVIEPDRAELVARIEARFDRMIEAGALDEVKALAALGLDPELPAMKAIGVRELQAAMAGDDFDGRSDRARQDRDAAICQAPGDLVPASARPALAARCARRTSSQILRFASDFRR